MSALRAVVFDTDGVLLDSARLHAAAWKTAFDSCLGAWTASGKGRQPPFDADHEYRQWVDGKPRLDGAAAFLDARGIDLPAGGPGNAPGTDTVWAVAARKEKEFVRTLEAGTVEAFPMPFGSDLHERFTQYGLPGTRPALHAYVGLSTEGEDKDSASARRGVPGLRRRDRHSDCRPRRWPQLRRLLHHPGAGAAGRTRRAVACDSARRGGVTGPVVAR